MTSFRAQHDLSLDVHPDVTDFSAGPSAAGVRLVDGQNHLPSWFAGHRGSRIVDLTRRSRPPHATSNGPHR